MVNNRGMGHKGQIFTKDATDEQRAALAELLVEIDLDESAIQPADQRDADGRRIAMAFNVLQIERGASQTMAERLGVSPAVINRLKWRLGHAIIEGEAE